MFLFYFPLQSKKEKSITTNKKYFIKKQIPHTFISIVLILSNENFIFFNIGN